MYGNKKQPKQFNKSNETNTILRMPHQGRKFNVTDHPGVRRRLIFIFKISETLFNSVEVAMQTNVLMLTFF